MPFSDRIKKFIETTLSYFGLGHKPSQHSAPAADSPGVNSVAAVESPTLPLEPKIWNPRVATTNEELAHVIYNVANGLAKQVNSPVFRDGARPELLSDMQSVSHKLRFISLKRLFPGEANPSDFDVTMRLAQVKGFAESPEPAQNPTGLMNALYGLSAGLKTQVLRSEVLQRSEMDSLRDELDATADRLHGLQKDVVLKRSVTQGRRR